MSLTEVEFNSISFKLERPLQVGCLGTFRWTQKIAHHCFGVFIVLDVVTTCLTIVKYNGILQLWIVVELIDIFKKIKPSERREIEV